MFYNFIILVQVFSFYFDNNYKDFHFILCIYCETIHKIFTKRIVPRAMVIEVSSSCLVMIVVVSQKKFPIAMSISWRIFVVLKKSSSFIFWTKSIKNVLSQRILRGKVRWVNFLQLWAVDGNPIDTINTVTLLHSDRLFYFRINNLSTFYNQEEQRYNIGYWRSVYVKTLFTTS